MEDWQEQEEIAHSITEFRRELGTAGDYKGAKKHGRVYSSDDSDRVQG